MKQRHRKFIALLRGINVGGHNKVPMAELRDLCIRQGWAGVSSYIQSGNLVFTAAAKRGEVETQLERAIEQHFGFSIPVIVRAAKDWPTYLDGNPFPGASAREPNLVALALSKDAPLPGADEKLLEYASNSERVVRVGDAIWLHFPNGSARSKLSPAVLDRAVGSTVTSRNWRTVLKLDEWVRDA